MASRRPLESKLKVRSLPSQPSRRRTRSPHPGVRAGIGASDAGLALDPEFLVTFEGERPHQIRLEGGDASSDSYCFP